MRKIILYTAVSLDGQIAPTDGSVAWLDRFPNPENSDFGYAEFYASIDTILVGNKTYQQALGFGDPDPFKGKKVYVFSRTEQPEPAAPDTHFIWKDIPEFVRSLKEQEGQDIWLCGGGEINTLLASHGLVDEMILSYVPMLIGPGIPLFASPLPETIVSLRESKSFAGGLVQSVYSFEKTANAPQS